MIIHGDSINELKKLDDNSIDTVITDPPYGLSFMGKRWDYDVPSVELWQECLRVLKPGGTALIFAGSRTQHRMAVNVEDAGFELKDCIMWLYGSGFPKATDISKQLDKVQGRGFDKQLEFTKFLRANKGDYTNNQLDEILGLKEGAFHFFALSQSNNSIPRKEHYLKLKELFAFGDEWDTYIEEAEREVVGKQENAMSGWNTDGSTKFVDRDITKAATPEAQLWEGWKSHGLKPAYEPILVAVKPNDGTYANNALKHGVSGLNIEGARIGEGESKRFPANILLDEEAGEMLGEPSRFFYCAKASKKERGEGNGHPTVKPLKLMEYLCTLTKTPTGGVVLDPFAGSFTTGVACVNTGRDFIGIEREEEYVKIGEARIAEAESKMIQEHR